MHLYNFITNSETHSKPDDERSDICINTDNKAGSLA